MEGSFTRETAVHVLLCHEDCFLEIFYLKGGDAGGTDCV
jgi:hypothetical protein